MFASSPATLSSFAMSSPYVTLEGEQIPQEQILGNGSSAVVVLQNDMAIKTPLRYLWSVDSEVEMNTKSVRREQDVYRRLQDPDDDRSKSIVRCLGFTAGTTQLAYMRNGDLRSYLANNQPPRQLQLQWFREMARALSYVHDKRVLVADVASRNFLLDSDLSLKLCDFTEATLLPADSDMLSVDDHGYNTQIDIGLLGAVIYEVVTGTKCEIDLFQGNDPTDGRAHWPERRFLPSTTGVWLGSIIERCWDGDFRTANGLLEALNCIDLRFSAPVDEPC